MDSKIVSIVTSKYFLAGLSVIMGATQKLTRAND